MTHLFARQVGPEGTVYAVDINPVLLEHVAAGAARAGLENVRTVHGSDRWSTCAPAGDVFTREILDAGFELVNRHDVPYLEENYVLRFRKPL